MKKLYRNLIVLVVAICFSAAGFIGEKTSAQTKPAAKSTPPTKSKKSPTAAVKAAPKPTPKASATTKTTKTPVKSTSKTNAKPSPAKSEKPSAKTAVDSKPANIKPATTTKPASKPTAAEQVIVTVTASRIRQQPRANSAELTLVRLGKTLPVSEKNDAWYRVEYATGKSGWISKTLVEDYEADRRDKIYREIAEKYSKSKTLDFAAITEVSEFLKTAPAFVRKDSLKVELNLRRLRVLKAALKAIPSGKGEQSPYKNFLKANQGDVVYSEPSGEWNVRSDLYWEIHNRFIALPAAEEIAWEAAQNPIPGECEGYVNCYLYHLRATDGEYLNFYPNGKYSKKALTNITNSLQPIVADLNAKSVYTPPTDISDRAEFNRFLTELRTIISKMPDVDKAKTLQQINQLGEGYK